MMSDRDVLQWLAAYRGAPWTGIAHALTDVGTSPKLLAGWALGAGVGPAVGRLARRRPSAPSVTDRAPAPGGAS